MIWWTPNARRKTRIAPDGVVQVIRQHGDQLAEIVDLIDDGGRADQAALDQARIHLDRGIEALRKALKRE